MSAGSMKALGAVTVALVAALVVVEIAGRDSGRSPDQLLLPELEAHGNDIDSIVIAGPDGATVNLNRGAAGRWRVAERAGYPADIGKLRELIVALAQATIVEEKTSNPDLYDRLGLADPASGGRGTRVALSGQAYATALTLGDPARRSLRYARVDGDPTSYLISENPRAPASATDWLVNELLDVAASDVRSIRIEHSDGEVIAVGKTEPGQSDVEVLNVPEGKELSFPTVANGMAGALSSLELSDVRRAGETAAQSVAIFDTWDGLRVRVTATVDGDERWFEFAASALDAETSGGIGIDDGEDIEAANPSARADAINERVAGWQYLLPDYKANLLTRRWSDLLKSDDDAS